MSYLTLRVGRKNSRLHHLSSVTFNFDWAVEKVPVFYLQGQRDLYLLNYDKAEETYLRSLGELVIRGYIPQAFSVWWDPDEPNAGLVKILLKDLLEKSNKIIKNTFGEEVPNYVSW